MPTATPVFTARGLSKTYQMGEVAVVALRSIDLDILEGEFLVLLGPSGSGKSTLLNILGGLDAPTGGKAWFREHDLVGAGEAALTRYRREHVGFVFQFYNLIPSLTVLENVTLVTEIAADPLDAAEALRLVGLGDRLDHFPSQLSGGEQQQRVAIARAIAKRPDVLLCDEPTGALDYRTGVVVLEAIARFNREFGTTTVVITHNAAIAGMADRVVHLADGAVGEHRDERASPVATGDRVVTMLNRKLLRDLRRMGGQVVTIAVVIGCGIAILVAAVATYQSLLATQEDYYRRGRFADVFASVKRAPEALAARLSEIPGIGVLETRVAEDVTITLPGAGEPLTAHIVSLPDKGTALLNRLYLREGRPIESETTEEVLVGEAFATANNLRPGGTLTAILNGRLKQLNIVGIVLSPEYVFATRPGDPIPDDARYGIMWMGRKGLASAFDMEGAFNDLTATLAPGADAPAVLDAIDRRLEPYGGLIAHARRDQPSHRFLSDEIAQQGVMATTMPTVFLAVAVFLLHGMLGRLVGTQREQVAALKALGYANRAIAWHYVKFALAIVGLGGAMGLAAGLWFGHMLVENYTRFFRFPQLAFHISAWILVLALAVSLVAGLAGALSAMRAVIVLAPAEAMRPPAPRRYHHGALERLAWVRRIPPRAQMVLRRLTDRPMRTLLTIFGIALAAPIIVMSLFWQDALDEMIGVQFATVERADLIVSFTNPLPARAEREIAGLPGVLQTEAYRAVPVQLRAGTRSYRTAITGLPPQPVLHQLVGNNLRVFPPPSDGLMLSRRLAERLALQVGERVSVEVLEGRRPHLEMTVTGLLDEMLGIGAYTTIGTVNRMMHEADAISSVGVAAAGDTGALRRLLSDRPNVATISERSVSLRQFRQTTEMFVLVMAGSLSLFSVMIAVGVVYNHARIALQERAWELASLRVLGFTRGEVSGLLLSELLLQLLIALPIGLYLGLWFVRGVIALHDTEMFEIPAIIHPRSYALAAIVLLLSGAASALLVRRRIDRLDLVSVLKTRE